ncbi:MAG: amidase [Candidatus Dormibacteria bacterium]
METSQPFSNSWEERLAAMQVQDAPYSGMVTWERPEHLPRDGQVATIQHPLAGMCVPIKDLVDTKGLRTTYGVSTYREYIPETDHPVVTFLRKHGAVIIGKSNTSSLGALPVTESDLLGTACNPRDPSKISGGSSGGAAVLVAAGTVEIAHGTDAAGSLRIPAACCGVTGWKSTPGLLPADASSMSERVGIHTHGFIARNATLLHDVASSLYSTGPGMHPKRLIVLDGRPFGGPRTPCWDDALDVCSAFGEQLECSIEVLHLPEEEELMRAFQLFWMNLACPESLQDEELEPHLREWRRYAKEYGTKGFDASYRALERFAQRIGEHGTPDTLFIHPTLGTPVPAVGMMERYPDPYALFDAGVALSPLGALANILRRPAVSFPLNGDTAGSTIPLSVTLIGPAWSDSELLGMVARATL